MISALCTQIRIKHMAIIKARLLVIKEENKAYVRYSSICIVTVQQVNWHPVLISNHLKSNEKCPKT